MQLRRTWLRVEENAFCFLLLFVSDVLFGFLSIRDSYKKNSGLKKSFVIFYPP